MKKLLVFVCFSMFLFSCAQTTKKVVHPNYDLMNEIYGPTTLNNLQQLFEAPAPNYQTLNAPTYIKVYHGSYQDKEGNVINGGFMWLKLSSGKPKTNF